jgi:serine phosphatase RsbU (regulator of sigma subunit)/anti-sigma regulatory factor (Ser/Thr protein kinase)
VDVTREPASSLTRLSSEQLFEIVEHLPDATTLSTAVRDGAGLPVDMRLEYMNTAAREGHPDPDGAIGGLCSELWPQMVVNGSFAACMRVLETGHSESGEFVWTETETFRPAAYDYHAVRVGADGLLWVLRDCSQRVRWANLRSEASRLASSTLDPRAILDRIAGLVIAELASWCRVYAVRGKDLQPWVLAGEQPADAGTAGGDALAEWVLRSGHPVLVPDVLVLEEGPGRSSRPGLGSCLGVPLVARGQTLGVLTMGRVDDLVPFDQAELALAVDLAGRAAVLVDTAKSFQRERHTAEVLQRNLLPTLPALVDLEVAARYAPAAEDIGIGGDWYDVIDLGAGRVAVVVGDVMGRGVHAAAVMGQLRAAIRSYAQLDLPPGEVLTLLDRLVDQLDGNQFVTCLYGVYDPASHRFVVANAGHFAPFVAAPAAGVAGALIVPPAPPLGSGQPEYEEHLTVVAPGTVLLLFTDGLIEVRDRDIDDQLDGLVDLFADASGLGLEELADHLLSETSRGRIRTDDAALLLMRVPSERSRFGKAWEPLVTMLEDELTAVREARTLAAQTVIGYGMSEDCVDVTRLLVSELVTNALVHGGAPVELQVRGSSNTLYIEVTDAARYRPHRRVAKPTDENGRGLELLEALARRWGVRPRLTGKVVWAEIPA